MERLISKEKQSKVKKLVVEKQNAKERRQGQIIFEREAPLICRNHPCRPQTLEFTAFGVLLGT
jgi:hypothetical protein